MIATRSARQTAALIRKFSEADEFDFGSSEALQT